jgi:hypothetical protein
MDVKQLFTDAFKFNPFYMYIIVWVIVLWDVYELCLCIRKVPFNF